MPDLDAQKLASCVANARDRYVRLHRAGSMATVSAMVLFDALRADIERTGRNEPVTRFSRPQLREAMEKHPAWEGKAYEETSFNTVPEDLGDQLQQFAHEESANGARWQFRFRGPTKKFRKDQSSRELYLEMEYEQLDAPQSAGETTGAPQRTPWISIALGVSALVAIAVSVMLLRPRPQPPAPPAQTVMQPTVAVLPFNVLTAREGLRFVGAGIADAIITRLSNIREVRVRPTGTILKYSGLNVDPKSAARELAAEYLLFGTLQDAGERFRARVQLVRGSDASAVWGRDFDLPRADLLSLEDSVAEQVAAALQLRLTRAEHDRVTRRYTENPDAYEPYLRGRAALLRLTKDDTLQAIAFFEEALKVDPNYAPAHAGLASACAEMRIRFAPKTETAQWSDRAAKEAARALALAPDLAEAHEALAAVARYTEFDWDRTMEESLRALALNPSLDLPHFYRSAAAYHLGLMPLATRELERGMEVNPTRPLEAVRLLGVFDLITGRFGDAERDLEEVARRSDISDYYLGLAYHYNGRNDRAIELLTRLGGGETRQLRAQAALASVLAAAGNRSEATKILDALKSSPDIDHHTAYSIGVAYAQLGDTPAALSWLQRAADTGFPCAPWYERDPMLAPIRPDAGFANLIAKLQKMTQEASVRYDR